MESAPSWTRCPESGCGQVTREETCANHAKKMEFSWAEAMPCPQCELIFNNPRLLRDHLHIVHWDWLVKLCDFCGQTFVHNEELKRHEMNDHSEIPMDSRSEKVESGQEGDILNENPNVGTSNNSAIHELLSEMGKDNLSNLTRAYIGTVRRHLDFQHQENFTDCLCCFTEDPLSVLFAGKFSNLELAPFHRQDTFEQLWRQSVMDNVAGEKENQFLESGEAVKEEILEDFNSEDTRVDIVTGKLFREDHEEPDSEAEGMDLEESDDEDGDLADYEEVGLEDQEPSDEMLEQKTKLDKDLVEANCDNKETKEQSEQHIDEKSLGKMRSFEIPSRRRIYGF